VLKFSFFSTDEARKNLTNGPSVRLKDAISKPHRYAEKLLVDVEILSRMFTELQTNQILEIVNRSSEYLIFKQTTFQVKSIEDRDNNIVKTASAFAVYDQWLFVADARSHCLWRVSTNRITGHGSHEIELFAGCAGEAGFINGELRAARFHSPMGLVFAERTGDMFVADTENNALRKINLEHGIVQSIEILIDPLSEGLLGASFKLPNGMCIVHGDQLVFRDMEQSQQKHCEDFRKKSEVLSKQDKAGDDGSKASEMEDSSFSSGLSSSSSSDLSFYGE